METKGRFDDRSSFAIDDRGAVSVSLLTAKACRDTGRGPRFAEVAHRAPVPMEHEVAHEGGAVTPRDRPRRPPALDDDRELPRQHDYVRLLVLRPRAPEIRAAGVTVDVRPAEALH